MRREYSDPIPGFFGYTSAANITFKPVACERH